MGNKRFFRKAIVFLIFYACIISFFSVNVFAESNIHEEDLLGAVSVDPIVRDELHPITPILIEPQLAPIRFGPYDYMIWHDHGGWWCDSEKKLDNHDDDLMCWAAACSNCLEYTGWGPATDPVNGDLSDTDEMLHNYMYYWYDHGGWMDWGWLWWYDDTQEFDYLDITEYGGGYWQTINFYDYYHLEDDQDEILPRIDEYLHAGYTVTLAIRPWGGTGGHALTCWGFQYDPTGYTDRFEHPENYYKGIFVTDSDDDRHYNTNQLSPNTLRLYNVTYQDAYNRWLVDYGGAWYIELIMALEPLDPTRWGTRPTARFEGVEGNTGEEIMLDASYSRDPDGAPLEYRWDFNDDSFWDTDWSSSPIITHTWIEEYDGYVLLEVSDGRLKDVHIESVEIQEFVAVDFTWRPMLVDAGIQIEFIDESMIYQGDIAEYIWDLGTKAPLSGRTPVTIFDDLGSHDVTLTLRHKNGTTITLTKTIEINEVTADYTWNPMPQIEGSTVRFKDSSTTLSTPITSWHWDFGDGEISAEQNPKHIYLDDGDYEVTLTVTNKDKTTHSVTNIAIILDMSPAAGFTYEPKPPTTGEQVTFTDLSQSLQDDIVSWQWDFGDGTTYNEQNPIHTYTEEGTYTVKLVVTDEDESIDSITYRLTVNKPSLCDKPTQMYSHGDPTTTVQHLLELINRARANPIAEGKRLGVDIEAGIQSPVTPQPPLAMNAILNDVAEAHCEDMREHEFSMTDSEGYSYKERIGNAGYPGRPVGENIATGDTAVNLYKMLIREVDPKSELNHREIILGLKYVQNEIGIGFTEASGKHDSYLTLDYGYQSEGAFLLGVVYLDMDEDGFYDVGEGMSGVTVMPSEGDYYAVTSSSGGYAIPITASGPLMVIAYEGELDTPISRIVETEVPGDNVKLDFIVSPDPVDSHELKITVEGMGVTCPDSGIVHRFGSGSQLLLSAKPSVGWEFSHWEIGEQKLTENPSELVLEEDQRVTAVFTETMIPVHRLVIAVEGSGTTDPPPGSMEVEEGIVSVEALPDEGSMFVEWMLNGEMIGDDNPVELNVEQDVKLVAFFMETIETPPDEVTTGNPISELIKALTELINKLLNLFGGS